jgi:hypothetical protein
MERKVKDDSQVFYLGKLKGWQYHLLTQGTPGQKYI